MPDQTQLFEIPADSKKANCRSCDATIYWIKTAKGNNMPVNPDGSSHFGNCPDSKQHHRATTLDELGRRLSTLEIKFKALDDILKGMVAAQKVRDETSA